MEIANSWYRSQGSGDDDDGASQNTNKYRLLTMRAGDA